MASFDLAEFAAATREIVEREIEEATEILRVTVVEAFNNIMELSPKADTEGHTRYRASNHMGRGPAIDDHGEPPGQSSYQDPDLTLANTIADETVLGELVSYWNDVGFDESKKPKSYAYFIEYGWKDKAGREHEGLFVYENASVRTEVQLERAIEAFNAKVIP